MKLLNFKTASGSGLGVKTDKGIIDVYVAAAQLDLKHVPVSMDALLVNPEEGKAALETLVSQALEAESGDWWTDEMLVAYAPCVGTPEKIICVGRNYAEHAKESGSEPPKNPILFSKFNNALTGHRGEVPLPPHAEQCDYEAELAVIIGKEVKNIPEDEALDAVFGYTCANDISARDLQFLTPQWLIGKSIDKFLPIGPCLVTADEVKDPQNLDVKLWLNDDLRQDSNTRHMIFPVKTIISFASKHFTLKPGDVIITGTPEGVILGREEKDWLKPGDEIVIEVGDLGRLSSTIIKGHD